MDSNLEKAAEKVVNAILDQGINPNYHQQALRRLSQEWPTLTEALHDLIKAWENRD